MSNINYNSATGHWEASFSPPITAELGFYDFQVKFEDTDNGESGWLTENDQVDVIKNNIPTADNLSYSLTEILRTNSITLYANGSDVEDAESDLKATFEYRSPNGDWEGVWISNVNYNPITELFEGTFTPQKQAELGLYDFRVKLTDLENGVSPWLTEDDQVNVTNNLPTAINLSYSDNEVFRTDSITLFANGSDIDDDESNLTPIFEYKSPNGIWESGWVNVPTYNGVTGTWEATFTPQKDAELGDYDFRVKFEDPDNGESGLITENDQVVVKNVDPTADDLSYSNIEVLRTNSIIVIANGSDAENDESNLTPTFEYKSPAGIWNNSWISNINYNITSNQWEATFTPVATAELGLYDFQVKFEDKDNGVSSWLTEDNQVDVKNNPPIAINFTYFDSQVFRTNSIILYINGTDVEDIELDLIPTFRYRPRDPIFGNWSEEWISNIKYNSVNANWEAIFTPPKDAPIGRYDLAGRFIDMDGDRSKPWLYHWNEIEVLNNVPLAINLSYSANTILRTQNITIYANGSDIENNESDLLPSFEYKSQTGNWESNWISGIAYNNITKYWFATFTPPTTAEPGLYDFQVKFTDKDAGESSWLTENDQVDVKNNLPNSDNLSYSILEVLRTDSITLYANGSDIEDDESFLIPTFQYRSPNGDWESVWITNINYIVVSENWEATFTPQSTAELGLYDFQVKFTDKDAGESTWLTEIDQVEVKNNLPNSDNLSYSIFEVLRTNSIILYANGSDIENDESNLTPTFEYKSPNGIWDSGWISNINYNLVIGNWEATFTPATTAELGFYDFQVKFTDKDSGESTWLTENDQVKVTNNIPIADNLSYSDTEVFRTDSITVYANGSDVEDYESLLKTRFEYKSPSGDWESNWISNIKYNFVNSNWEATFTPPTTAELGLYGFRVNFTDLDSAESNLLTNLSNVTVKNNPPVVINITSLPSVYRGDAVWIYANGSDIEDDESILNPEFEYSAPSDENNWYTEFLTNETWDSVNNVWKIKFTPHFKAEIGYYDIRVKFKDKEGDEPVTNVSTNWTFEWNIINVLNNLPISENISYSNNIVLRNQTITIFANGTDREDKKDEINCTISYKSPTGNWEFLDNDTISFIIDHWEVAFRPGIDAELGLYDFRVRFIDRDNGISNWLFDNNSVNVTNNVPIAVDLNFSLDYIIRTQTLYIYANATDVEDPESLLNCEIQYKSMTGAWTDLVDETFIPGDHWEASYRPNIFAELGFYDFRVRFTDLDKNVSNWLTKFNSVFVENKTDIIQANVTPNATIEGEIYTITVIINGPLNSTDAIIAYIQKGEGNIIETIILQKIGYRQYSETLNTTGLDGLYVIDFYAKDVIEDVIYKNNFACFALSSPIPPNGVFTGFYKNITNDSSHFINAKSFVNITLEIMVEKNVVNASVNFAEYYLNPTDEFEGSYVVHSFAEIEPTQDIDENLSYMLLTFYYDETSLPNWLEEENLRIYYWNDSSKEWEITINSGVHIVDNYLWANITNFGIYGIFVYSIDISCLNTTIYTRPNEIITNSINVKNIGSIRDEISLYITNVPDDLLASLNKYSIWLDGGEEKNVILTIYVQTQVEGIYDIFIYGKSSENLGYVWDYVIMSIVVDNTKPTAITGDDLIIDEDSTVDFSAEKSTDNFGIEKYSWDFDASDGIQEDALGMNVSHLFTDPGIYTVTLTVTDHVGFTGTDTSIITVLDTRPPDIPTNLTVTKVPIGNQLYLSWHANKDKDLVGYNIYRSLISGESYTKINTFIIVGTSYQDTDLANGIIYYYVITAIDLGAHESDKSVEANGFPGKEPFSFGPYIYVDENNAHQYFPSITTYENKIYAVWTDYRNGDADIYFAKSNDGSSFEGVRKVNDDINNAHQFYPSIVVNNYGIFIVWEDYRNGNADIYFAYSGDDGVLFSNHRVDHDLTNSRQTNPSIALKNEKINIVWEDKRNGAWDVYYSYSTDKGATFSNEIKVNNATTNVNDFFRLSPTIAINGEIYVSWHDNRNGNYDIFFSKSIDGTYFEEDIKINDDLGSDYQLYPVITFDNKIYVAWQDLRNGNWDIYAGISTDGITWNNICIDNNTSDQINPSIAHGSDAYVAWQDLRNGDWDIYASNINDIASVEVIKKNKNQHYPSISIGKNIYVAWQDENNFWNIGFVSSEQTSDSTPPSIYLIRTQPNKLINGEMVTISAVVTDPSGVSEVKVYVQKGDENNILEIQLYEIGDGTYVNTIITEGLERLYVIDLIAKDYYNNSIELENRACFAVTSDDSCTGIYQGIYNGINDVIDARPEIDLVLEINTKTDLINSSICMAEYSTPWKDYPGAISLNKFFEIVVENTLSEAIKDIGLKIYYTDEELGMTDENKMKIYNFNETSFEWEELKTYINAQENYIWANLTHFSIYGVFETIIDVKAQDSINGNPEETVIHEFTVRNLGPGDTMSFEVNSSNVWNINLIGPNSLYFDEDETKKIIVEVTIPTNALAYAEDILYFYVNATNTTASLSIETKTIVNQVSKVIVTANIPGQILLPGQFFNYQFTIENLGNGEDNFTFSAISTNNWERFYGNNYVVLGIGKSKTVSVRIAIPLDEPILAGTYDLLTFEAKSKLFDSVSSASVNTTVGQTFGVVLRCDFNEKDSYIFPNDYFRYTITIINNGNGKDTFDLAITEKAENWDGTLSRNAVTLDGFESTNVTLTVKPPFNANTDSIGVFTVKAVSNGEQTKFDEISTFSTIPLPDLWVKEIYYNVYDAILDGQVIEIFAKISNSGSIAKNFWVKISVLESGAWVHLMDTQIHSLGPGKSTELSIGWEASGEDIKQVRVEVDHTKRVFESNEMNNELISKKIIIVPHERVTSSFQSGFLIALISVGIIVSISSVNKRKRKKK